MTLLLLPFVAMAAQQSMSPPATIGAVDVVAAFKQLCMPEFPDTAAIAAKARLTGWDQFTAVEGPHQFKGFGHGHSTIFSKSEVLATVRPGLNKGSGPSCGVTAPLDSTTLAELAEQTSALLKLPRSTPSATDNEVEWTLRDGTVILASIGNPRKRAHIARRASITIFAPGAGKK